MKRLLLNSNGVIDDIVIVTVYDAADTKECKHTPSLSNFQISQLNLPFFLEVDMSVNISIRVCKLFSDRARVSPGGES